MRRVIVGAAMAVSLSASVAVAADFPNNTYRAPSYAPAVVAAYSWMGPYIGANLGYEWGRVSNSGGLQPSGITGGIQGGYNWQYQQFVFGGEADINLSGASDTFAGFQFSNPWFSTLRGRAGIAMNNILFYGTVGFAFGGGEATAAGITESKTHTGWTAGLGIEVGLTQNWSARAEYLYLDLAERGYTVTLPPTNNGLNMNVFRLGANYRF